ncbi:glycosyltransferase family 4 protein [Phormidium tenue]|uniref:Glycosyl transferase n=1 Tax=Phormidium tenue NIES-30 TaxID=549789 RepID=A0A1U7JBF9_9CYAN|nr:glycosyltransferase family 4 protein [Phormidium tenue]MBD2230089.1 glycosyltransferase family 4 protein [Phormidium tenue FACHB-1052]OKH51073.1 glycosyl transferase [Phormidium tenue NIES-30]
MKILHINQSDILGGAAIAGYQLHGALLNQGLDSKLLVGQKKTDDPRVAQVPRHQWLENQLQRLTHRGGFNYVNHISSFAIPKHPFFAATDILNFHNLHNSYFSYLAIPRLTEHKPAVFTLHDMWSFTGHCAYSYDCARWQTGCGHCPYPETYPGIRRDSTHLVWKLKDWIYNHSNLTIVAPSRWLAEQAKASVLGHFQINHIPNGVDPDAYQPLERELCRTALGIPAKKRVMLFSAINLTDSRKGGDLLIKALNQLPATLKKDCLLLTLGHPSKQLATLLDIPLMNLGYVSSDRLKSVAYSAADLFLFPTRADNLPLVLQESMACGTPMVSFDIGGVSDLVRPGITGYLAQPEDIDDFCKGIVELLDDNAKRQVMGENCRRIALKEYTLDLQAIRYSRLYQEILDESNPN